MDYESLIIGLFLLLIGMGTMVALWHIHAVGTIVYGTDRHERLRDDVSKAVKEKIN